MTDNPHRPPSAHAATRTSREVGHRRRQTPTVENMASPPRPPLESSERPARIRPGRIATLGAAVVLTATIAIASLVVPDRDASAATSAPGAALSAAVLPSVSAASRATEAVPTPAPAPVAKVVKPKAALPALPPHSGAGRRIVFDQSDQRVWLVEANGKTHRSYLVSGSRFDNLKPGTYSVTSRQRHAVSFDNSGTMEYFMRFATGYSEPIGFHAIPVYNNGKAEQTLGQLGTALSAGCVRQKMSDAKYLWDWAPDGTTVVVTA